MGVIYKSAVILIFVLIILEVLSTAVNFGKFKIKSLSLEKCKGPKKLDCCDLECVVENNKIIHYNLTAFENVGPLKAKITVATNDKGLVRLQVNKVCEHIYLKPVMATFLNITDKCVILKGKYSFSVDTEGIIQKYYAGEFFYGNITIHAILNNNKCNFSCTIMHALFVPKNE